MISHCLSVEASVCLESNFVFFYPRIHMSPPYFSRLLFTPQMPPHLLGCSQERAAGVEISNFDADSHLDLDLGSSRKGE